MLAPGFEMICARLALFLGVCVCETNIGTERYSVRVSKERVGVRACAHVCVFELCLTLTLSCFCFRFFIVLSWCPGLLILFFSEAL